MLFHHGLAVSAVIVTFVLFILLKMKINERLEELAETRRVFELERAQAEADLNRAVTLHTLTVSRYVIEVVHSKRIHRLDNRCICDHMNILMVKLGFERAKRNRILLSGFNNGMFIHKFSSYLTEAYLGKKFTVDFLRTELHPPPYTEIIPDELLSSLVTILDNVRISSK